MTLAESFIDRQFAAIDARQRLSECLQGLDGDRKVMIDLANRHGWSREELASRYRPVATIKTLLRRGLIGSYTAELC